jgi:hypothetical protein
MKVDSTCRSCKKIKTLEVNEEGFTAWKNREKLIQDALPELDKDDRELLISGTCGTCFSKMFGTCDEGN